MYYSSFVCFQVFTTLKYGESSSTWDLCEANCHQHNYTKNIFVVSVICLGMTHTCTKWIDSYLTLFSPVTIVFLCTNPIVAAQPSGHASIPNYTNINCLPSFFEGGGVGLRITLNFSPIHTCGKSIINITHTPIKNQLPWVSKETLLITSLEWHSSKTQYSWTSVIRPSVINPDISIIRPWSCSILSIVYIGTFNDSLAQDKNKVVNICFILLCNPFYMSDNLLQIE